MQHAFHPPVRPRPGLYWADLLISAAVGWTGLALLILAPWPWAVFAGVAAVGGLYRAVIFVHELCHQPPGSLPGLTTAWSLLVGWPCWMPLETYAGMHRDHHSPATYGSRQDPEYLPLAGNRLGMIAMIAQAALLPIALAVRFILLAPIGWAVPPLRRLLDERASSLSFNPTYRRRWSTVERRRLRCAEVGILIIWSGTIALCIIWPDLWRLPLALAGTLSVVAVINATRTVAAHGYRSPDGPATAAVQAADGVDIPGAWWTEFWAPVGLRYHAVHHLQPGLPYHALAGAHRWLVASGRYAGVQQRGLVPALGALWRYRKEGEVRDQNAIRQIPDAGGTVCRADTARMPVAGG